MKIGDLQHADDLATRRQELLRIIHELNGINGGAPYAIPVNVLEFVDRQDAAKGLTVLAIQGLSILEAKLAELGVEIPQ